MDREVYHTMDKIHDIASPMLFTPDVLAVFIAFLTYASIMDFKTRKISDNFNRIFLLTALMFMYFTNVLEVFSIKSESWMIASYSNYIGMALGFLILFIPAFIKNVPMGGDIKLSAVVGFWVGAKAIPIILLLAVLSGGAYGMARNMLYPYVSRQESFPFAPFILVGSILFYGIAIFV